MKLQYSLLAVSILSASIVACGSGSNSSVGQASPNSMGPNAIIPPSVTVVLESHSSTSAAYTASSNNPYYQAYTVTNKSTKGTTLGTITISGTNAAEFRLESATNLYPVSKTRCVAGSVLAGNASCEVIVSLTNPTTISITKLTANLGIVVAGIGYNNPLSKTSYAYVGGNFSQAYPNPALSISGTTPSGTGSCGVSGNKQCQLLEYNLANNSVNTILNSDYSVNSMALGANGTIYVGGGLTTATAGSTTVSQPGVGSLVLAVNPALTKDANGISDVIAQSGLSGASNYPDGQIYSMGYNQGQLYIAGGFQNMAGITSPGGYPLVTYGVVSNTWNNVFTSGDPDLSISAIGFNNNKLYLSGAYSNVDGNNYNPSGIYGNFPMNECTTANAGVNYSCAATDYVVLDSTGNLDGMPQPAASIMFDSANTLYAAGGFSKIATVGTPASANYMIATSSSFSPLDTGTWASSYLGTNYPDNVISSVLPYAANKFLTGGFFSTIGGVAADANPGTCGSGALSLSGTKSCMLAQYNGTAFSEVFTTDGWINSIVYSNKIGN